MQVKFNEKVNEADYVISQEDFHSEMNKKKEAPRYIDGVQKKANLTRLKHEKLSGPFTVAIFKTDMGWEDTTDCTYSHVGTITLDENEFAYVYRDSLMDGYTEAYFCDDNTLLMDVRHTKTREKTAVKISGEPTGLQSWNWDDPFCDDKGHGFKKLVDETIKALEAEKGHKVYGVIQIDEAYNYAL